MTTVAYKDGVMASDSRCSDDFTDRHLTVCDKIFRLKSGALLGICGDDDCRDLIKLLDNVNTREDLPSRDDLGEIRLEGSYLLVLTDFSVWHINIEMRSWHNTDEWLGSLREIKEKFAAIGSGSDFAIGAMEAGASAKKAVECAIKWDLYSGPPVITVKL